MLNIESSIEPSSLSPYLTELWHLAGEKVLSIESTSTPDQPAPVFTVNGRYTARGWTEWTHGFQFGAAILVFDATDDEQFLDIGRRGTVNRMATHVSHVGVHDHGFNNVSTYGNLRRLMIEGRIPRNEAEKDFYELGLKVSGAVQAARWTELGDASGYIYSFNGPHSLFSDTIRSLRALILAHQLEHRLMGENDRPICLLQRALTHAQTTAIHNVYYGDGRDHYDIRGRVAHESLFNTNDGNYRCPSTQQGYSPFSTWTRGLAWIMSGFAEQIEYLRTLDPSSPVVVAAFADLGGYSDVCQRMYRAAEATCDFYIEQTPTDGVPYWDTGAPGLSYMGDFLDKPSDPFNDHEPVDSSAAAIAAQGLLRFGRIKTDDGDQTAGRRYQQAGLTILKTLLNAPYISSSPDHQGLLLHSIYHRPNGWDHVPSGSKIPYGEASMWGDYHLLEAALLVQRMAEGRDYLTFFDR